MKKHSIKIHAASHVSVRKCGNTTPSSGEMVEHPMNTRDGRN